MDPISILIMSGYLFGILILARTKRVRRLLDKAAGKIDKWTDTFFWKTPEVESQKDARYLAETNYREAYKLYDDKNFKEAINYFQESIKYNQNNLDAIVKLSFCYKNINEIDKAIEYARQALYIKNDIKNLHAHLGVLYGMKEYHTEAIEELKREIEIFPPGTPFTHFKLAQAYFNRGYLDDSIKECDWVIANDPNTFEAFYLAGICYLEKGMFDKSISYWKKAQGLFPDNPDIKYSGHIGIAEVYITKGEYDNALDELKQVESILNKISDDKKLGYYLKLAGGCIGLQKYSDAKLYLDEVFKDVNFDKSIEKFKAYTYRGFIALGENQLEEAFNDFQTALKLNFKDADVHYGLYLYYKRNPEMWELAEVEKIRMGNFCIPGKVFFKFETIKIEEPPKFYREYEVIEKNYASGDFATIHKARNKEGILVAIKELQQIYSENEKIVKQFVKEVEMLKIINHPNIVKIFEDGLDRGRRTYWYAMEWADWTLREAIQTEVPMEITRFKEIILPTGEALNYLHTEKWTEKGEHIVHRDLKPSNILFCNGQIKISDFGVARIAETYVSTRSATISGVLGNVRYNSPEVDLGKKVDRRADIYSLGIIMYEMLTGRHPFIEENEFIGEEKFEGEYLLEENMETKNVSILEVVDRKLKSKIKPPSRYNDKIPSELDAIVMKALTTDRKERWQKVSEILEILKRT